MNKKGIVLLLILVVSAAGMVYAQEGGGSGSGLHHWISGEVSLLGVGARYEYMLDNNFSIGGTVFWHSLFLFWNSVGILVTGRWYPWGGIFYAEAGIGFGTVSGFEEGTETTYYGYSYAYRWPYVVSGFMFNPGVGWKIDLGEPGGFYINPMINLPIVFGKITYDILGSSSRFKVGINFRPGFGMGYAF
jgi:hypothetical protein